MRPVRIKGSTGAGGTAGSSGGWRVWGRNGCGGRVVVAGGAGGIWVKEQREAGRVVEAASAAHQARMWRRLPNLRPLKNFRNES